MNAATLKQIDRATATGDAQYLAATLAPIHRASGPKVRNEIEVLIEQRNIWNLFTMVGGEIVATHTL